jgi:hypothetical protein
MNVYFFVDRLNFQEHEFKYLILSNLGKDYLGCVASSSSVEQTFSAEADVCTSSRGKLLLRAIERSVSSGMWLRDNLPLGENFEGAARQRNNFKLFCEEKESHRLKGTQK